MLKKYRGERAALEVGDEGFDVGEASGRHGDEDILHIENQESGRHGDGCGFDSIGNYEQGWAVN